MDSKEGFKDLRRKLNATLSIGCAHVKAITGTKLYFWGFSRLDIPF